MGTGDRFKAAFLSCAQPLHGVDAVQPLNPLRFSFPLGLDDVPEELKSLADELS